MRYNTGTRKKEFFFYNNKAENSRTIDRIKELS